MTMNKTVVAFDFDGTLTSRDSFLLFTRFAVGGWHFWRGMLRYLPQIVLIKAGLYPGGKLKEQLTRRFFEGWTEEKFDDLCRRFAAQYRHILRPKGLACVEKACQEGAEVVVITASIANWVQPFLPDVRVIGTQMEVKGGALTGLFSTPNCRGKEKVRRLKEAFPNRESYRLVAYGDSSGDKEMLNYADESHYRAFE